MTALATLKGLVAVSNSIAPVLTAGTYNVDFSGGNLFQATLAGDVTLNLVNLKPGYLATLNLAQDATGGRRVTWGSSGGGIAPAGTATLSSAIPGALAVDLAAGAESSFVFEGTSQTCTTAKLVARTPSLPTGDEVFLAPTDSDDTANVLAVLTAGKVAVLGPPGSRYFLDGRSLALSQANCGGIRLMQRVEVQPTAAWVPAIGLVDDPSNSYVQVRGAAGAYSSTTPNIQRRGSRVLTGVVSTAGLTAGMALELKASPTGGRTLPEDREIVLVESVPGGGVVNLAQPLRLNYGDSINTLPVILTSLSTVVQSFFIECGEGAFFNTLGRNIAGVAYVERAVAAWEAASAVTAGTPRRIRFDSVAAMGCTRAIINYLNVASTRVRDAFSAGLNNGMLFAQCSHNNTYSGFRSTPTGPYVAATGPTRTAIWSEAGGSDNRVDDFEVQNMSGGVHFCGGYENSFGRLESFALQPDIRFTRDPGQVGLYLGALFCQYVNPGTNEPSFAYKLDGGLCRETYVDAVTRTISPTSGVHSFVFVDTYDLNAAGCLQTSNMGNGTQLLNGVNWDPCGGVLLFDCFYGARIESIHGRNVAGGSVSVNQGGFGGSIGCVTHDVKAGISTDTQSADAIVLGAGGANSCPRIERVYQPNGGNLVTFTATFSGNIDYGFNVGRVDNQGSGTVHRNVCAAINSGAIVYFACDVTALDPAAAAGTRQCVEAAADQAAPVIVAQTTNTGIVFVALDGGSVLTTGAANPTSLLTAEGGATHRAKVNAAATLSTLLGRPTVAKGAGNAIIEARGGI